MFPVKSRIGTEKSEKKMPFFFLGRDARDDDSLLRRIPWVSASAGVGPIGSRRPGVQAPGSLDFYLDFFTWSSGCRLGWNCAVCFLLSMCDDQEN